MSKLTDQIREYVRCPQLDGGTEYGKWGALSLKQRRLIKELCEEYERQKEWADTFFKETQLLKHQLAEKDIVIEVLQRDISNLQRTMEEEAEYFKQQIRHQVCEEIRHKAKWINPPSQLQFIISAKDLKQIEQGE